MQPLASPLSYLENQMTNWKPSIKKYPHFDAIPSLATIDKIVRDHEAVAKHAFFPFLKYDQRTNLFSKKGEKGKIKERPIRYAAHLDSCIFSYYRHMLSVLYEEKLKKVNLEQSVLAYRRIINEKTHRGCCNIDYAYDAIKFIRDSKKCFTISLDISNFFENINHKLLYNAWLELLENQELNKECSDGKQVNTLPDDYYDALIRHKLPNDHYHVFKAVTKYAFVDLLSAYKRLGFYGNKKNSRGIIYEGYLLKPSNIPRQLCSVKDFRQKIAGDDGTPSLIQKNTTGVGIPQGAPMSDLLANLYLFEFDKYAHELCNKYEAKYFRYSDDILIIGRFDYNAVLQIEKEICSTIKNQFQLEIKEEKSAIHEFISHGSVQSVIVHKASTKYKLNSKTKPFEYLGFRFDGKNVFIRDKTMSNLHRKITYRCRATALSLKKRYSDKSMPDILKIYNFENLYQSFGNVERFFEKNRDYNNWTFNTYAKRASKIFDDFGKPIQKQISGLRRKIKKRFEYELSKIC